jgi:hypothetical protein
MNLQAKFRTAIPAHRLGDPFTPLPEILQQDPQTTQE